MVLPVGSGTGKASDGFDLCCELAGSSSGAAAVVANIAETNEAVTGMAAWTGDSIASVGVTWRKSGAGTEGISCCLGETLYEVRNWRH